MIDVYTDGSARDGKASFGYSKYVNNQLVTERVKTISPATIAVAELSAILLALVENPGQRLRIYCDSEYIVKTLLGEYKIKKHKELWTATKSLFETSGSHVTHVRAHNKNDRNNRIDKLVRNELRTHFN